MKIHKNQTISGVHQKDIITDIFYRQSGFRKPIVIFCHGYKGFKDWGAWNLMAESFAHENLFFIKFNFSYNGGTLLQPEDFPDLDAFSKNNYVKELDDLQAIINWVAGYNPYHSEIDNTNISVIGHSRGGGIACIKAAEEPKIKKLITWAGVSDYEKRFPVGPDLEKWNRDGIRYVENARTKQQMPHDYQFYQNFKDNQERLTIQNAVQKLKIPYLIIHGKEDTTVSVQEAIDLHSWYPESELLLIDQTNHVFGAQHPWTKGNLPESLHYIIKSTIQFALL